ncbi:MAG: hypothetical protein HN509_04320, partial [Halobacteriovoraceae bacterium]|nr:hypothetical protein [Halobacteriovoraceae bacterium]
MSDKNWLIRTSSRQLLGPISKEKLLEVMRKGSLGPEDELSSGNGYWFHVREKDLVDKYIYGDVFQSFNPISEAEDVLTKPKGESTSSFSRAAPESKKPNEKDGDMVPSNSDLEFPDMEGMGGSPLAEPVEEAPVEAAPVEAAAPAPEVENTHPASYSEDQVEPEEGADGAVPSASDLEFPDMGDMGDMGGDPVAAAPVAAAPVPEAAVSQPAPSPVHREDLPEEEEE